MPAAEVLIDLKGGFTVHFVNIGSLALLCVYAHKLEAENLFHGTSHLLHSYSVISLVPGPKQNACSVTRGEGGFGDLSADLQSNQSIKLFCHLPGAASS